VQARLKLAQTGTNSKISRKKISRKKAHNAQNYYVNIPTHFSFVPYVPFCGKLTM